VNPYSTHGGSAHRRQRCRGWNQHQRPRIFLQIIFSIHTRRITTYQHLTISQCVCAFPFFQQIKIIYVHKVRLQLQSRVSSCTMSGIFYRRNKLHVTMLVHIDCAAALMLRRVSFIAMWNCCCKWRTDKYTQTLFLKVPFWWSVGQPAFLTYAARIRSSTTSSTLFKWTIVLFNLSLYSFKFVFPEGHIHIILWAIDTIQTSWLEESDRCNISIFHYLLVKDQNTMSHLNIYNS